MTVQHNDPVRDHIHNTALLTASAAEASAFLLTQLNGTLDAALYLQHVNHPDPRLDVGPIQRLDALAYRLQKDTDQSVRRLAARLGDCVTELSKVTSELDAVAQALLDLPDRPLTHGYRAMTSAWKPPAAGPSPEHDNRSSTGPSAQTQEELDRLTVALSGTPDHATVVEVARRAVTGPASLAVTTLGDLLSTAARAVGPDDPSAHREDDPDLALWRALASASQHLEDARLQLEATPAALDSAIAQTTSSPQGQAHGPVTRIDPAQAATQPSTRRGRSR